MMRQKIFHRERASRQNDVILSAAEKITITVYIRVQPLNTVKHIHR